MAKLVILGTSNAIPHHEHENTHMVLVGSKRMLLIDGPGNPMVRLHDAGLSHENLTDILMTHFHPDHVSGIPLLLMGMGLLKREKPLNIYANEHCMDLMKQFLEAYQWDTWHFFPVNFYLIPEKDMHVMLDCDDFTVYTSPVKHFIPTVGIRVDLKDTGKVLAYSCDTAPTQSLIPLSKDADLLIHEAAGASIGHASAKQAGEIAKQANAKEMWLIHYPTHDVDLAELEKEASEAFGKQVKITTDLMEFEI
jgi:ribonuclease Z